MNALVTADLAGIVASLCGSMPGLPACAINDLCAINRSQFPSAICEPSRILDTLCTDVPYIRGCTKRRRQCTSLNLQTDAMNPDCATPIPHLPTSKLLIQSIHANICSTGSCASLREGDKYSDCDLVGTAGLLCAGGDRKYLHVGINDYILFREWLPQSTGQYAFGVVAVLLLAFLSELDELCEEFMEQPQKISDSDWRWWRWWRWGDGWRKLGLVAAIRIGGGFVSYLLMLVVMSFNLGFFVSALVGLGAGKVVFCVASKRVVDGTQQRRLHLNGSSFTNLDLDSLP
ncbi:hypothetical protein BC829DRAFT_404804 [Chytridium lagenaria]|nr:hypothetical protein BC829DRAFT_404804 [Chytridium lagenaria]